MVEVVGSGVVEVVGSGVVEVVGSGVVEVVGSGVVEVHRRPSSSIFVSTFMAGYCMSHLYANRQKGAKWKPLANCVAADLPRTLTED